MRRFVRLWRNLSLESRIPRSRRWRRADPKTLPFRGTIDMQTNFLSSPHRTAGHRNPGRWTTFVLRSACILGLAAGVGTVAWGDEAKPATQPTTHPSRGARAEKPAP